MARVYKPVVLIVLDGFGVNLQNSESTWRHAQMPTFRSMEKFFPFTTLQASGVAVGLPWGVEGNSEVGHFTMGAGKALFHHLPRIIMSIHDGSFYQNPAFKEAAEHAKKSGPPSGEASKLHFMGLVSSGSVHAYIEHLYALLEFSKKENIEKVYLHLFTDGRDSPDHEGAGVLRQLEERLAAEFPNVKIASVSGRNFAMDRDDNWEKIERMYKCLTEGEGEKFQKASQYAEDSYQKGLTDEFIEPAFSDSGEGLPALPAGRQAARQGKIEAGDAVVFFNFREDSVRELTSAFVLDNFPYFPRQKISDLFFVTMTQYDKRYPAKVAFPPLDVAWPLARVVSEANLKQLHVAETEKYAHVTYFFNGGHEAPYPGEERILVSSPKVASYDEAPEMSADKICETVLEGLSKYDFILANFANADMVGHTGEFDATVKALEVLDFSVGKILSKVLASGGILVVTSDHGNAEEKIYSASGEKRTKHTPNPIPFFLMAEDLRRKEERSEGEVEKKYPKVGGLLTDIAPTVLELMGLRKPADMTGVNLLPKIKD